MRPGLKRALLVITILILGAVIVAGAKICWLGSEALSTGANPTPWLVAFTTMIVLPACGVGICLWGLLKKDPPGE